MGNLTDDMTRLVSEIGSLRNSRKDFVLNLGSEVSGLLCGFNSARAEMSFNTRKSRKSFVKELSNSVNEMRKVNKDDLKGARTAWGTVLFSPGRKSKFIVKHKVPVSGEE